MDSVFINDLVVEAIVGIYDYERRIPQELVVNVEMGWDNSLAAHSGNIEDALDYASVSQKISEFIKIEQFFLLETLAEEVVSMIMRDFKVPWVRFRCAKTQALKSVAGVGVVIERGARA